MWVDRRVRERGTGRAGCRLGAARSIALFVAVAGRLQTAATGPVDARTRSQQVFFDVNAYNTADVQVIAVLIELLLGHAFFGFLVSRGLRPAGTGAADAKGRSGRYDRQRGETGVAVRSIRGGGPATLRGGLVATRAQVEFFEAIGEIYRSFVLRVVLARHSALCLL